MDVLSEVLKAISLDAAFFYNAEFTAPWSVLEPSSEVVAPHFSPSGGHVIMYHLVTEGRCLASVEGGSPIEIAAGDIVIFPHGDAHILGSGSAKVLDVGLKLREVLAQGLKPARLGGGGEMTRIVCGYMSCDPQLSTALLAGLPPLLRVPIRDDASGQWLENNIRFSVSQAGNSSLGGGGRFVEAIGSVVCGNNPALRCATSFRGNRMACRSTRSGSRQSAGFVACCAGKTLDDRNACARSWDFSIRPG